MKKTLLIISLIISASAIGSNYIRPSEDELSRQLQIFLDQFDSNVASHNWQEIVGQMEKNYKTEQLDNALGGDTLQFIKEFFCGLTVGSNNFICPEPDNIYQATRNDVLIDREIIQVNYHVVLNDGTVLIGNWFIRYYRNGTNYVFGLIGAVG
ncbi:MAG: hypothetical protein JXB49_35245 [Bacteroidales bacterium]|nr:hypothetical protein [Bacteroidales bacterium]